MEREVFVELDKAHRQTSAAERIAKGLSGVKTASDLEAWEHAKDLSGGEGFRAGDWSKVKSLYSMIVNTPDVIPGGVGDHVDRMSLDPMRLLSGVGDELVHSGDISVAADIATDHLSENPNHYHPSGVKDLLERISKGVTWKKAAGFPGYSVSSGGNVRNDATGRILAKPKTADGYELVTLMRNGEKHSVHVHTLVARTFHGKQAKGKDVRHKNTDKEDNSAKNTAYGTRSENMRDTYPNGHKRKDKG